MSAHGAISCAHGAISCTEPSVHRGWFGVHGTRGGVEGAEGVCRACVQGLCEGRGERGCRGGRGRASARIAMSPQPTASIISSLMEAHELSIDCMIEKSMSLPSTSRCANENESLGLVLPPMSAPCPAATTAKVWYFSTKATRRGRSRGRGRGQANEWLSSGPILIAIRIPPS